MKHRGVADHRAATALAAADAAMGRIVDECATVMRAFVFVVIMVNPAIYGHLNFHQ